MLRQRQSKKSVLALLQASSLQVPKWEREEGERAPETPTKGLVHWEGGVCVCVWVRLLLLSTGGDIWLWGS